MSRIIIQSEQLTEANLSLVCGYDRTLGFFADLVDETDNEGFAPPLVETYATSAADLVTRPVWLKLDDNLRRSVLRGLAHPLVQIALLEHRGTIDQHDPDQRQIEVTI